MGKRNSGRTVPKDWGMDALGRMCELLTAMLDELKEIKRQLKAKEGLPDVVPVTPLPHPGASPVWPNKPKDKNYPSSPSPIVVMYGVRSPKTTEPHITW
jgi:hypothetical protein